MDFFKLMVMNESHAVLFGPTGAGKTGFIDNALSNLSNILPSHMVVVLDVVVMRATQTTKHRIR